MLIYETILLLLFIFILYPYAPKFVPDHQDPQAQW